MDRIDDFSLIDSILSGNKDDFAVLYDRYVKLLFGLMKNYNVNYDETEDVAQEVFYKVYKNLGKFQKKSKFSTWFYQVSINVIKDYLRKKNLKSKLFFWYKDTEEARGGDKIESKEDTRWWTDPHKKVEIKELNEKVSYAVSQLKGRQKEVMILRVFQGLKIKEIAAVLELKEGSVKTHLFRAVENLKKAKMEL